MFIPLYRTFLNWIIAVLLGSILWPMVYWVFDRSEIRLGDVGGIVLISMILSGLSSLPALAILLVTSWQLNKRDMIRAAYVRVHAAIHLLVALLTFLIIYVFSNDGFGGEALVYLVIAATYTAVGLTTWSITFLIYKKKAKRIPMQPTELLDNTINQTDSNSISS